MRRNRYESKYTREDIKRMINEVLEIITADCKTTTELSEHIRQARDWADSDPNGVHSIIKRLVYRAVMGSTNFKVDNGITITSASVDKILKRYKYAKRRSKHRCPVLYSILYRNWDDASCEYTLVTYDALSLTFHGYCQFGLKDAVLLNQHRIRREYQYEAK